MLKLSKALMIQAFTCLDKHLEKAVRLIVGGGGAMILAHDFSLATLDVDGIPASGMTAIELEPMVKLVAEELSLAPDWLNPYYSTFTHVLPSDYGKRLIRVFEAKHLKVEALSGEDLLIMKCFAARQKDVVHARALVKKGADCKFVRSHIEALRQKRIPLAERALQFLSEIEAFFEGE